MSPSRVRNCRIASISSRVASLLRDHMVKTKHHQSVRVCEHTCVYQTSLPRLVDPLINRNRLFCYFAHNLLKRQRR